jgi:hypothetical protein
MKATFFSLNGSKACAARCVRKKQNKIKGMKNQIVSLPKGRYVTSFSGLDGLGLISY